MNDECRERERLYVYVVVKIEIQSDLKFAQSKLKFQFCLGKIEIRSLSNELLVRIGILILTGQN